ncbi:MAG: hypothetical protein K2O00_05275 [Muribaculaceae bacterium]|nr:hypothetical protein [Muribaculaceae bacterium]
MDPGYFDGYIKVDDNICFIKANNLIDVIPDKSGRHIKVQIELDNDYLPFTYDPLYFLFELTNDGLKYIKNAPSYMNWAYD